MKNLIDTLNEKELKELFENTIQSWQVEKENEQEFIRQTYENAKTYAREEANQENFFMNSIGFWKKTTYHPRREADYTSFSHSFITGKTKKSSEYWYTKREFTEEVIIGEWKWLLVAGCSKEDLIQDQDAKLIIPRSASSNGKTFSRKDFLENLASTDLIHIADSFLHKVFPGRPDGLPENQNN